MESKYLLLAGILFLLFGCTSQPQTQFVCSDNSTVSDPSLCPPGEVSQQTWSSNAYVCPDGSEVGSPIDCSSCPATCDDGNPCTSDICNQNTGFACQHSNLNGPQTGCEGSLGNCQERTCSSGTCKTQQQAPCCGSGKCEQGETCSSCPQDCGCMQGSECCGNICREPLCATDYDCGDGLESTLDECIGTGCNATCMHTEATECMSGDGACPEGCNYINDTDCPYLSIRYHGNVTDELKATITSKATRHCFGVDKDKGKDYGYFLVLTVDFENDGLKEKMIPTNTITVFVNGEPYYSNLTVPGDCDTSGMFADDEVRILSKKHTEGELWFALGKENELKCGFDALLDKAPYGGEGVLVWHVPC